MLTFISSFFFFNDTATTEIYTLSLHDALPISDGVVVASTSYSYRVRATDAAGNLGPYSNILSVTTPTGPVIRGWTPANGPIGTPVTISGTGFGATQGTSTLTCNGISAMPTSCSATSVTEPV